MLRLAFDFIITWRETRTRPNAYSCFHGNILPARYICWSFAAMGVVGAMWYIDRRLPTVSGPLQIFSHRNILVMKTMR